MLDYAAPTLSQSTGTLAVRAILQNPNQVLLPGYFVRVRVADDPQEALLVPTWRSAATRADATCWSSTR